MGLAKESVKTAWEILHAINPKARNSFIQQWDKENNEFETDVILGADRLSDGGWENVFMNVRDITVEQLDLFNDRKEEVPNSDFIKYEGNGITCLGWF